MREEVVRWLVTRPGGVYLDATVGAGGHAAGVLDAAGPSARLIGLDRDPEALQQAAETLRRYDAQVTLRHGNFAQLGQCLEELGVTQVDGLLMDLGVSSLQLDRPARGFSVRAAGPLDMRMDPAQPLTAAAIVNSWAERELADLIARGGEARWARRIARAIVGRRPFTTTTALAAVLVEALPRGRAWSRIHPATRTFQALRIVVNRELESLEAALPQGFQRLRPGARIAVLAYHSLEDRVVKRTFRAAAAEGRVSLLTRRPMRPTPHEVRDNPRSRSARLRVAERFG